MDYAAARQNMVDSQLRTNKVTDAAILAAFESLPRERFLPENRRGVAYIDEDIAVAEGRYMMEPMVLARLLQAAEIEPGDMALEIGAGAGYAAAVLARLVATVVALESDAALSAATSTVLQELGVDNVVLVAGVLNEGYAKQAPYNVILINGAVAEVPAGVAAQLADGGRLVAVIKEGAALGRGILMQRRGDNLSTRVLFDAATPYLPGFAPEPSFVF